MKKNNIFIAFIVSCIPLLTSASIDTLPNIELDDLVYSFNEGEGFIEDFKIEEQTLNSILHPTLVDDNYSDIYYVKNVNNQTGYTYLPEWQFKDVLYDEDSGADVEYVDIDGETYQYHSSFITYGNAQTYNTYDRKTQLQNGENGAYYWEQDYDGECYPLNTSSNVTQVKAGFSSVQGVALISNDIYINSLFDEDSYMDQTHIDIALKNESGYDIDFEELINVLSYSSYNAQFQFPLIKMDNEELVNLICNGQNAYLVTHNCEFKFNDKKDTFYLSFRYREFIEKITISIPFFIGGFSDYFVKEDYDGNTYAYKYLVGESIREEIYQVMTGFRPYLWNDDINNDSEDFVKYCPVSIDDIDIENNKMIIKSILPGSFSGLSALTLERNDRNIFNDINLLVSGGNVSRNAIRKKLLDEVYIEEDVNYWNDYYEYEFKISSFTLNNSCELTIKDYYYAFNTSNIRDSITNIIKPSDLVFEYTPSRKAMPIYADANYKLFKNPSFWEECIGYKIWAVNGKYDDWESYREFLYFDFYWDKSFENKIEKIESMNVVIPKNDGSSIKIDEKNLQSRFDEFLASASSIDQFISFYNSKVNGHYNFLEVDLGNMSSSLRNYFGFDSKFGKRFVYSNYCGTSKYMDETDKFYPFKLTHGVDRKAVTIDKKVQATLMVYLPSGSLTKATTNKYGLHVEYDDTGKVIGVFDSNGELNEEFYFDEETGFIKETETDNILGDNNFNTEDNTDPEVDEELKDDVLNPEESLGDKIKNTLSELFSLDEKTKNTFLDVIRIILFVFGGFLVIKIVSGIISLFKYSSINRNIKQTNKMLKQQNRNKRKRKR